MTKNGQVILANDPHIGFSQPSVWYEAHISTPNYEMYGYHLGGVPFPLLSHNKHRANGMTMFQNDDLDFIGKNAILRTLPSTRPNRVGNPLRSEQRPFR